MQELVELDAHEGDLVDEGVGGTGTLEQLALVGRELSEVEAALAGGPVGGGSASLGGGPFGVCHGGPPVGVWEEGSDGGGIRARGWWQGWGGWGLAN